MIENENSSFLIRWRGRQEGPFTAAIIEAKLAANQIGLLHEIQHNGQWVTLRDYFAERDAVLREEYQAKEEQKRQAREEAERYAKELEAQRQTDLLTEERRKNDLLQSRITDRQNPGYQANNLVTQKPHRAGTILTLGIIGLFICGPLCLAAWVMGDNDIREMDAGKMDNSGRSTTGTGRFLGIIGTLLWIVGIAIIFIK